ncbi:hypothetical protein F5Y08DRAFT_285246 [Xylaria arbuscula]|nr:hypothetical protein F5Y08DRAFT_285246 [Xylaria arbuscula]
MCTLACTPTHTHTQAAPTLPPFAPRSPKKTCGGSPRPSFALHLPHLFYRTFSSLVLFRPFPFIPQPASLSSAPCRRRRRWCRCRCCCCPILPTIHSFENNSNIFAISSSAFIVSALFARLRSTTLGSQKQPWSHRLQFPRSKFPTFPMTSSVPPHFPH